MFFFFLLVVIFTSWAARRIRRKATHRVVPFKTKDALLNRLKALEFPKRGRVVVGVDFTASPGKSHHVISYGEESLYERVLGAIVDTVSFGEGGLHYYLCGFGSAATTDVCVSDLIGHRESPCVTGDTVTEAYRAAVRAVTPGPVGSIAPLIFKAIGVASEEPSSHIVLFVLTHGFFCDSQRTRAAVREAARYNISIVVLSLGGNFDHVVSSYCYPPERQTSIHCVDLSDFQVMSEDFAISVLGTIPGDMEARGYSQKQ